MLCLIVSIPDLCTLSYFVINGQASDWAYVLVGVPQGSILGPLLFLIIINDIVKHIGCSIRLFTDDTSVYIIVGCPLEAGQLLNREAVPF